MIGLYFEYASTLSIPKMPAVETIQIILLSINLFVKDWFVGWLNGSLDARYSAIHSWHP